MTTAKQLTNVAAIATIFALGLQLPASAAAADQCTAVALGGSASDLRDVLAVAHSSDGLQIFAADYGNSRALVLDAATGNTIEQISGTIIDVAFPGPDVLDMSFGAARKVQRKTLSTGVTTTAGSGANGATGCADGDFNQAEFSDWGLGGLSGNPDATITAVTDRNCHSVRFIDWTAQTVTSIGLNDRFGGRTAAVDGAGSDARFDNPSDVDWSPDGTMLVVSDDYNHAVRLVTYPEKVVSTLAGAGFQRGSGNLDGVGTAARFSHPRSVSFSPDSKYVIVADMGNKQVRKIEVATAAVSTITGLDGVLGSDSPWGIDWHPTDPTKVIVADRGNNKIQILTCAELVPPPPPPTGNPTPGPTGNPTQRPSTNPTLGPTGSPSPGPTVNPSPGPTPGPTSQIDALEGTMKMVLAELISIKDLLNQRDQAPACYGRRSQE